MAEWFPLCDGHPLARIFDDVAESSLIDWFKANYIEPGIGGKRQALASLCLNSYSSTPPDEFRRDRFCASSRFLCSLKRRHNLTMRRPHAEKFSTIDDGYTNYFCERTRTLQEDSPPELVFNMEETCWRLFEALRMVLEEKGKETVKLRSERSEKTSSNASGRITLMGINFLYG
jgi:hypothetical protein